MSVTVITEDEKRELESRTAKGMPYRPGDEGWTADQVVRKLYEGTLYLASLLESFELQIKNILDGTGEQDPGICAIINSLAESVRTITSSTFESPRAMSDHLGNVLHTTYATIQGIQNGTIAAKKYLKGNGQVEDIESVLTTVQNNLATFNTFVGTNFTNGKANLSILADRAKADQNGDIIHTTYGKKAVLDVAVEDIAKIKNGNTIVEKANKDRNGDILDATYFKIANIINVLNDTSTNKALSAYQGKILQDQITAIQALLESPDTELDELQEIVAYIKNNKSLIEGITVNKISFTDIVNNLTSNVVNKPLSAAQGYALKALYDNIVNGTIKVGAALDSDKLGGHNASEFVRTINGGTPDPTTGELKLAGFVGFKVEDIGDSKILKAIYLGNIGGTFSLRDDGDDKYLIFTPNEA